MASAHALWLPVDCLIDFCLRGTFLMIEVTGTGSVVPLCTDVAWRKSKAHRVSISYCKLSPRTNKFWAFSYATHLRTQPLSHFDSFPSPSRPEIQTVTPQRSKMRQSLDNKHEFAKMSTLRLPSPSSQKPMNQFLHSKRSTYYTWKSFHRSRKQIQMLLQVLGNGQRWASV